MTPTYLDIGFSDLELAEQNGCGRFEDDYHHFLMQHGKIDRFDLHYENPVCFSFRQKIEIRLPMLSV